VVGGSSDDAFAVEPDSSAHLSAVARSVAELCDLHADAGRAALQLKRAAMLAVAMVDGDIDEFVSTIDDDGDDDDDYNGNAGEQADARDSVATASSRVVARSTPSYLVALLHTRQPKLAASNRLVNALALVSITVAAHLARLRADSNVFGRTAVVNAATLHARAAFRALLPLRTSWCSTMVWSYDSARADDVVRFEIVLLFVIMCVLHRNNSFFSNKIFCLQSVMNENHLKNKLLFVSLNMLVYCQFWKSSIKQ